MSVRGRLAGGMARRLAAALVVAAGVVFAATPAARAVGPSTGVPPPSARGHFISRFVGKPAPDFTLTDVKGARLRLSSLRGKVVLLNFWYSSCPPCRRETPDLAILHRRQAKNGLEIIGINLDDVLMPGAGRAPLTAFLAEFKVPYRVLLADEAVFELYGGVPVQPTTFLVDREGKVGHIFWGAYPGPAIEKELLPYLAPPAPRS